MRCVMEEDELTTEEWLKRIAKRRDESSTTDEKIAEYLKYGTIDGESCDDDLWR